MWTATQEARASWICRTASERARFLDLQARLLKPNTRVLVLLSVVMVLVADNPLTLTLPLVALVAVSTLATVHRDSDIENRGAATIDALTGMLNRTALIRRRTEIEAQSRATGEPVGLIVIDLDRFKTVNDTQGHGVGDIVLRDVAYVMRRELRAYDLAYRLGGEEFAVLLPGADLRSTAELAGRLHAAVAAEPIAGLAITISLGVAASTPGTPFSWDDVFDRADAALYRAKQGGRDQVVSDAVLAAA